MLRICQRRIGAAATRYSVRARCASTATGELTAVCLRAADVGSSVQFYADACQFKANPAQSSRARVVMGTPLQPHVALRPAAEAAAPLPPANRPAVTVGVSNLKTAARNAKRHEGTLLTEPAVRTRNVPDFVARDPGGNVLEFLHVFRRNPVISLNVWVRDAGKMADFCTAALGLRPVTDATELTELHLPRVWTGDAAAAALPAPRVFTGEAAQHSMSLVVRELPPSEAGEIVFPMETVPIACVRVADVGASQRAAASLGFETTPVEALGEAEAAQLHYGLAGTATTGASGSFLCMHENGYVFEVSGPMKMQ